MPRLACLFAAAALLLSGCNLFLRPEPSSSIPARGLVAYYPFSGNARDASGNGYHGTNQGAAFTADRFGRDSAAYSFDGADSIDLGDVFNDIEVPFTISLWAKSSDYNVGLLFHSDADSTIPESVYYGIGMVLNNGRVLVSYTDGQGAGEGNRRSVVAPVSAADEEWVHIVGVVRGADDMILYMNGEQTSAHLEGFGGPLAHNERRALIGRYFNGVLDDVALYNRALSPAEVARLYTAQR